MRHPFSDGWAILLGMTVAALVSAGAWWLIVQLIYASSDAARSILP